MVKLNLENFFTTNTVMNPIILKKNNKFLVIMESINIWGEGNTITEAYINYEKEIEKSKKETNYINNNLSFRKEVVWRRWRNIFLISVVIISFAYAQISVISSLAYKFYNVEAVITLINEMNKKIDSLPIQDKKRLKTSINNISNQLNDLIN